ncbi:hypothetical protein BDW69DRAFT_38599 [Aspergillus filifer]
MGPKSTQGTQCGYKPDCWRLGGDWIWAQAKIGRRMIANPTTLWYGGLFEQKDKNPRDLKFCVYRLTSRLPASSAHRYIRNSYVLVQARMPRPAINLDPYRLEISQLYLAGETPDSIALNLAAKYQISVTAPTIKVRLRTWGIRKQNCCGICMYAQRKEGRRKLYQLHECSLLRIGCHMTIDSLSLSLSLSFYRYPLFLLFCSPAIYTYRG